jgi:hypothetical protein
MILVRAVKFFKRTTGKTNGIFKEKDIDGHVANLRLSCQNWSDSSVGSAERSGSIC